MKIINKDIGRFGARNVLEFEGRIGSIERPKSPVADKVLSNVTAATAWHVRLDDSGEVRGLVLTLYPADEKRLIDTMFGTRTVTVLLALLADAARVGASVGVRAVHHDPAYESMYTIDLAPEFMGQLRLAAKDAAQAVRLLQNPAVRLFYEVDGHLYPDPVEF